MRTWAEEGEVGPALVAHVSLRGLPARDEVVDGLGGAERVLRVVVRVVEHLYKEDSEREREREKVRAKKR